MKKHKVENLREGRILCLVGNLTKPKAESELGLFHIGVFSTMPGKTSADQYI